MLILHSTSFQSFPMSNVALVKGNIRNPCNTSIAFQGKSMESIPTTPERPRSSSKMPHWRTRQWAGLHEPFLTITLECLIMAFTLPKTNKSPKHWWFSIGISKTNRGLFLGVKNMLVSGYLSRFRCRASVLMTFPPEVWVMLHLLSITWLISHSIHGTIVYIVYIPTWMIVFFGR